MAVGLFCHHFRLFEYADNTTVVKEWSVVRKRNSCVGGYFAAFGFGMLAALIFPIRFILIVAAVALVLAGLSLVRC